MSEKEVIDTLYKFLDVISGNVEDTPDEQTWDFFIDQETEKERSWK